MNDKEKETLDDFRDALKRLEENGKGIAKAVEDGDFGRYYAKTAGFDLARHDLREAYEAICQRYHKERQEAKERYLQSL